MELRSLFSQKRHGIAGTTQSTNRIALSLLHFGFKNPLPATAINITIVKKCWSFILSVQPVVSNHVVEVAITIKISSYDAVPPPGASRESSFLSVLSQLTLIVSEKSNRSPFPRYEQIQPAIAIDISP